MLARVYLSPSSSWCEHTRHEQAHRARSCLVCPSLSHFLWMPRTWASTDVLACVLIPLSSTPCGRTGHERAHRARPCPGCLYPCPFDTAGTSRTRASTSVLARFLISLCSTPCGHTGHERAHRARSCPYFFIRHLADTQDMSEHTGARLYLVCLIKYVLDIIRHYYKFVYT